MIENKKMRVQTVTYDGTQESAQEILKLIGPNYIELQVILRKEGPVLIFGNNRSVKVSETVVKTPDSFVSVFDMLKAGELLDSFAKKDTSKGNHPTIKQGDASMQEEKDVLHIEVCKRLGGIYHQKNLAYNDSVGKAYAKSGPSSLVNRLMDKINRIDALTNDPTINIGDENLEDTFLDLANYAIMGLIEMKYNR